MAFEPDVFAQIRPGSQRSAAIVVPEIQRAVQAHSVVDVGGGEGWWTAEFAALGARAVCIDDGSATEPADRVEHVRHDISTGLPTGLGTFDLALCLEVVEHLDARAGDRLVDGLCELAPSVLFSAAVPGQGGHGHINEQWPTYWVERFQGRGFACSGALRWLLWDNESVKHWYRQNLLFMTTEPERYPVYFDTPLAEPWDVVHPETFRRWLASQ